MTRQSRLAAFRSANRTRRRRVVSFVVVLAVLGALVGIRAALPGAASTAIASDTFHRPDQPLWGTASDGQVWGGDANAKSVFSIVANAGHVGATNGSSFSAVLGGSATDEDVQVTGALSVTTYSNFGPVARWQDTSNWYKAYLDGSSLILQRKVAGTTTVLAKTPFAEVAGASYTVELKAVGASLTASVGATSVTATDATFAAGRTGLRVLTQSGSSASITNFQSTAISGPVVTTTSTTPGSSAPGSTSTTTTTVHGTTTTSTSVAPPPPGGNLVLDYVHETAIDPLAWGADETGYQTPDVLGNDATEQQMFKKLGITFMRMDLKVVGGQIVCAAGGCDSGVSADAYVTGIFNVGATPVIIVPTADPLGAAQIVAHYKGLVHWYLVGNEPNINGYSAASYTADWNADAAAMRAVDPTIKIGGPTPAWFDQGFVQTWLNTAKNPDFIDFHGYPTQYTQAFLFSWSHGTGNDVAKAHAMAVATLGHDIPVEVGEWSLDDANHTCTRSNLNTVWAADVLGEIVQHGGISLHYGTKGNMLEWATGTHTDCDSGASFTQTLDTPQAPYEGYTMFTGAGLFHAFGTKMAGCTAPAGIDCFASDGGSHNIVLVNTGTTAVDVTLPGSYDVWQRAPGLMFNAPPTHLGTLSSVTLPGTSVTTVVAP
jgi:hypothetical protein